TSKRCSRRDPRSGCSTCRQAQRAYLSLPSAPVASDPRAIRGAAERNSAECPAAPRPRPIGGFRRRRRPRRFDLLSCPPRRDSPELGPPLSDGPATYSRNSQILLSGTTCESGAALLEFGDGSAQIASSRAFFSGSRSQSSSPSTPSLLVGRSPVRVVPGRGASAGSGTAAFG